MEEGRNFINMFSELPGYLNVGEEHIYIMRAVKYTIIL